jgi:hypothetical protein
MNYQEIPLDKRTTALFYETIYEFKNIYDHKTSNYHGYLNKLKNINDKLVNYIENKCPKEYQSFSKSFLIKTDKEFGTIFEPTIKDSEKIIKEVENCINKDLGINTIISEFENDYNIVEREMKLCVHECTIRNVTKNELKLCFKFCLADFFDDYSKLSHKFENELNIINNKI